MSTTLTAVAVDDGFTVASIGDSRAYLLRDRSVVLAALDGAPGRTATVTTRRARAGDRLLVRSDGLSEPVDDPEIRAALADPSRDRCADRLVELALAAGGPDNVSVVVADVVPRTSPAAGWG